MTTVEFSAGIERLKIQFGNQAYGETRAKLIYAWAKTLSKESWFAIIDSAISECERPPLLPKLKDIWQELKKDRTFNVEKIVCFFCNGDGWYVDPASPPPFTAYACKCAAGDRLPKYVAKWRGDFMKSLPTQSELNWRAAETVKTTISKTMEKMK